MATPIFSYMVGDTIPSGVSRVGAAYQYDINGVVISVPGNVPRDGHYLNGVRTLLLEGQRSNAALQSQVFNNAAWVKSGCTIAADTTAAPDLTNTADSLIADAGVVTAQLSPNTAYLWTANRQQAWSLFVKPNAKKFFYITTSNKAGVLATSWVNLVSGEVVVADSTHTIRATRLTSGWFRWELVLLSSGTGASSARVNFGPSDAPGITTVTGDGVTASCFLWGAQMENDCGTVSSYHAVTVAPVNRSTDFFQPPLVSTDSTIARTLYADFIELGEAQILSIAAPNTQGAYAIAMGLNSGGDTFQIGESIVNQVAGEIDALFFASIGTVRIKGTAPRPFIGDRVEMIATTDGAGSFPSIASAMATNGAYIPATNGPVISPGAIAGTFISSFYSLGPKILGGTVNGSIAIRAVADFPGVLTMQECRDSLYPPAVSTQPVPINRVYDPFRMRLVPQRGNFWGGRFKPVRKV